MNISNQDTISEWSKYTDDDLQKFGDLGDKARQDLLDPTILKLLGSVKNKKILDAGCGNGYFSRKLAKLGAEVDGVEPADALYEYCLKRASEDSLNINYSKTDLSKLDTVGLYDTVVLINVLMDIPDYKEALGRCIQSLKMGGELVISILHPCFPGFENEWSELGFVKISEYFNSEPVKQKYGHLFQRTLQDYINSLIDFGCILEQIVEPQLPDTAVSSRNVHVPQFLVIKCRKINL